MQVDCALHAHDKILCRESGGPYLQSHHLTMVRAVGIEPTLLAEPDFEWGAAHLNRCFT